MTYTHRDTTIDQYHGYLLPDVSLMYKPLSWLTARLSYTSTLSYPDFTSIIPTIDIFSSSNSVTWNNFALKPAHSQNYNVQLSFYNNAIGLFTVGGFLKRIDDMIFTQNSLSPTPLHQLNIPLSRFPGLILSPKYTVSLLKLTTPFVLMTTVWSLTGRHTSGTCRDC